MPQVKQHTALLVVIFVRVSYAPASSLARPNSYGSNIPGAKDQWFLDGATVKLMNTNYLEILTTPGKAFNLTK